jgi:fatty-acyl-CoA synthase
MGWAAYRSGLYFTPLPTTLASVEIAHLVEDSEARLVIVDTCFAASALSLPGLVSAEVRWLSVGGTLQGFGCMEEVLAAEGDSPRTDETPGNLMFYTSGTTGRPKGVMRPLPPLSHSGPPPFASDLLKLFDLDHSTRYLSTAPLYHAAPLRFSLAVTAAGGTVHVMERFDALSALNKIVKFRITHTQWVPTMFQRLLRLPADQRERFHAPDHRVALHAAAPCPVPLKEAMIAWWGPIFLEYYSGSEGVGLTAITSPEWLQKRGSVGQAKKGVVHILDDQNAELPAGQAGRVFFSGVSPFAYFNDPLKTAAHTSPQGYQTFGDIGYVDGDGYLFLTDRMGDMIISGGVNVYPQEIEMAIREVPEVAEVGVVGTSHPDFGESAVAFIVPRSDLAGQSDRVIGAVMAHCQTRLGRIKRPSELRIVDSIPYSETGKLLRRVLREWLKT